MVLVVCLLSARTRTISIDALSRVAFAILSGCVSLAVLARRGASHLASFSLCLSLGIAAGCGGPAEEQTAPSAAKPHLTTIASSALAAVFAARPSGNVAMDSIGTSTGEAGAKGLATTLTLDRSQSLYVLGWAFPPAEKGGCSAIGLAIDGKLVFPGTYGYRRPDVAVFYKDRSRTDVGYGIAVPASSLGRGSHRGFVVCMDSAQSASRSFHPLTIRVR